MKWTTTRAVVFLPAGAMIYAPGVILWITADIPGALLPAGLLDIRFWIGIAMAVVGLLLVVWPITLFDRIGKGTPAHWAPPVKLVVLGPYRHVRNPMNSGMLFILAAETLLFGSWPLAIWMGVFFVVCAIYFPYYEEPGLERRFGDDYRQYKENVPRWIPRLRPWKAP